MPCDASGMAEIHRAFKAAFRDGVAFVEGVADGDAAHAEVVAKHLNLFSVALHTHHEFEDQDLWGKLRDRAPACALHVDRMQSQHAAMLVQLNALDAALPTWRASGSSAAAQPVLSALAGINSALDEHLPDEETKIVPLMEEVLTQPEVDAAADHGRRATPKGQAFPMLGGILAAQPDGGTAFMHKNIPPPVRLVWRAIGRRKYEANRQALLHGPR
ncbi:hemerythrin domain-containing protein [Ornithinimicrobium cryptoxanthini]|uniref:Hemerythrin domain-containing protein n=1 Tax=Ornithinimicrobium cryptoxanthini TaxID=2934161 RepID=A0ABY4YHR3_9MICO|nr:hemerythrin domain-containing protein [Ornithinimicrobium cryptoxanthini]USQ76065.1 hemerythrin domain-containing protein [Ornithinimicrobium cryptoxanthini]